jgi:ligand-binding SRPBCC domain-containing protein
MFGSGFVFCCCSAGQIWYEVVYKGIMASQIIKSVQQIPASLDELWAFFSDPRNLVKMTPASMDFRIISTHHGTDIYPGQIIEYKLRPVAGISVYWMTEITHVKLHTFFVDEQRKGPYALWHHQHHFKTIPGGVEMTDLVHYRIPFGIIGKIANTVFVRKKLERIFQYRRKVIESQFGLMPSA